MKKSNLLVFALTLLILTVNGPVAAQQDSINRLMELSGLTKQLSEFPALVQAGFVQEAQGSRNLPAEEIQWLSKTLEKAMQPSDIIDEVRSELLETLSERDIRFLLKWYESGIGQRITRAENEASTVEAYTEIMANAGQLLSNQQNVEMAATIDDLAGITDMAVELQANVSITTYSMMVSALTPDEPTSIDDFKNQVSSMKPQIREQTQPIVYASLIYTYRNLDESVMDRYMRFLNLPTSQKFMKASVRSMARGIAVVLANWAKEISVAVKSRPA